jgi:uncharacterized protein YpmB
MAMTMQTTTSTPSTSPLDKNVQTFDQRLNVSSTVYIIGLILALVASALMAWYGNKLGKAKDEQYKHEKLVSDEKIAAANEGAEIARRDAAQANEGLGESNEKIAVLNTQAEALRVEAEKARAGIASAQADAARANERAQELARQNLEIRSGVANLEKEAADAKRKQAEAELRVTQLAEQQQRQLTPRVFFLGDLAGSLKDKPKGVVEILFAGEDDEAHGFAQSLMLNLSIAGWQIVRLSPISSDDPSQVLPEYAKPENRDLPYFKNLPPISKVGGGRGITLLSREMSEYGDRNDPTRALLIELTKRGFPVNWSLHDSLPNNFVRIVVGAKP